MREVSTTALGPRFRSIRDATSEPLPHPSHASGDGPSIQSQTR